MDRKATRLVRMLGMAKIPMLAYAKPKVLLQTDEICQVLIPLRRRTKNHLGSMYLGALCVGADLCAGLPAFQMLHEASKGGPKLSFVFQDMQAQFLYRPDGDVTFTCRDIPGLVADVAAAIADGERHSMTVNVEATVPGRDAPVATFQMTLSYRCRN